VIWRGRRAIVLTDDRAGFYLVRSTAIAKARTTSAARTSPKHSPA
jgi:hypothetical protein